MVLAVIVCVEQLAHAHAIASNNGVDKNGWQFVWSSELVLALGSLLALCSLRALATCDLLCSSEALLITYARRQGTIVGWSGSTRRHYSFLAGLWSCSMVLRGIDVWQRGADPGRRIASALVFGVTSGMFTYPSP